MKTAHFGGLFYFKELGTLRKNRLIETVSSHSFLRPFHVGLTFLFLLALLTWIYIPGFSGILVFDDIPNLLPWQDMGDIDSLPKIGTFLASGIGFPGRPLSLLSFLIDDQSWSPDMWSLKRTNLAIHLLNTCLIFWLTLRLFQYLLPSSSNSPSQTIHHKWLALAITAVWALHPLQVSNVSYVIQRMNLLSTLLELSGLLFFIYGRGLLLTHPKRAFSLCSIGIGFFMPMAILAKENGLLLCVFALLVEAFCFRYPAQSDTNQSVSPPRIWAYWKVAFLWLPLLAFSTYCMVTYRGFTLEYPTRNFNSWERLLTQGPVIIDYLNKLFLPRLQGSGLYFDNFPVSRSLFSPISTLFSWIMLIALLVTAWLFRRRNLLFSFGVFFYFGGHLMESTLLPLELYFEHRNYLPQWGLWLALMGITLSLQKHFSSLIRKMLIVVSVCLLILLTWMTHNNATLWGSPDNQTAVWYHDNPTSLRTTLSYSNLLLMKGEYSELYTVLEQGQKTNPNTLVLPLSHYYVSCYWEGKITPKPNLVSIAKKAEYESASILMLEKTRKLAQKDNTQRGIKEKNCPFLTENEIAEIYVALTQNPKYVSANTRSHLFEYLAEIAADNRKLDQTMYYYDQAFVTSQNAAYPYRQALLLQSAGLLDAAIEYNDKADAALTPKWRAFYPELPDRISALRQQLTEEKIKQESHGNPH